ncbi:hypothetical protein [Novosphingobium sp. AAP83]|uniref:hypothetical protein n=1 Tax=Novosphingobium sp. AAP83 TaxID=1523425 RepID=UPI000A880300|nr:hypothetical protein [Novosphingobium sp. AAP83]
MKSKMLDPNTINDETIKTILDNAAIEHQHLGGIYVTAYPFNFWIDVDQKRKLLIIYTYWDAVAELDEIAMLRFVNHANCSKIMLQFAYRAELGRFYGYYTHPYDVGLFPPHVLKLLQKFSSVFTDVVHEGIAGGVLQELPSCTDDDESTADVGEKTVH